MVASEGCDSWFSDGPRVIGNPELLPSQVWSLALNDAAIGADRTILFVFPGRSVTGNEASSWVPGTTIDAQDEVEDFGDLIHAANSGEVRGLHRVAIWPDERPREVSAALLRHELEHSRQYDRHGTTARDLFFDAINVLVKHAGEVDGAGVLYQHIPMERDADAAASGLVRRAFSDATADIHADDYWPLLARNGHSPDPVTIRSRMQQFVEADGPELAERFALGIRAGANPKQFRRPFI